MPGMEENPKIDFMFRGSTADEEGSSQEPQSAEEHGDYRPAERPAEDPGVLDEAERREREDRDRAERHARSEPIRKTKARDNDDDMGDWRAALAQRDAQLRELTGWAQRQELARQQALQQQQAQQEQPPDYEDDPAGYLRWQNEQLERQLNEVRGWAQQRQQLEWQAQQEAQFVQHVQDEESRFRQEAPDYDAAVEFLKQNRDRELKNWGIRDRGQREHTIQQEILFLTQSALNQGISPARAAYEMAHRHGYGRDTPEYRRAAELDRDIRNARTAKKPAKSKTRDLSLEHLADLEGPEFDRAWAKMFGSRIS